jgi:hypothetical protein
LNISESGTEAEMVLAFLRAELDSPTYPTADNTAGVRHWLAQRGFDPSLIEAGDPTDASQNAERELVLGDWRGYKRNTMLFLGFPDDVDWHWATLPPEQLARARYTAFAPWPQMSGGTRLVADGARNLGKPWLPDEPSRTILAIAKVVEAGRVPPEPLILVGPTGATSADQLVLLEGYKRATAYVYAGRPSEIDVLVGFTARLSDWLPAR